MWVGGSWLGPAPLLPSLKLPVCAGRRETVCLPLTSFLPMTLQSPCVWEGFPHRWQEWSRKSVCSYCAGENQCNVNRKSGLYVSSKHCNWKPHAPNEIYSCVCVGFRAPSAGGEGLGSGGSCSVLHPSAPLISAPPPKKRRKLIRHFPQFFHLFTWPPPLWRYWTHVESTGFAALSISLLQGDGARLHVPKRPNHGGSKEVSWT